MKPLRKLMAIAIVANLVSFLLFRYISGINGPLGVPFVSGLMWIIALWLVAMVIAAIILRIQRKPLFEGPMRKWTMLTALFCTPLPAIALFFLLMRNPEIYCNEIHTVFSGNKAFKTEYWYRRSTGKRYMIKRYVSEVPGSKLFKKDSLWVYFNEQEDTLKTEFYRGDALLRTMDK